MATTKIFQTHDDLYIFKVLKSVLESRHRKQSLMPFDSQRMENRPDIILLDIVTPRTAGWPFASNMQFQLDENPILILASHARSHHQRTWLPEKLIESFEHEARQDEVLAWITNYLSYQSQLEPKRFYENLILSQFRKIMTNWKTTINKSLSQAVPNSNEMYLDALFLFNAREHGADKNFLSAPGEDQNPLEQTLINIVEFCPACLRYDIQLIYACPTCESPHLQINFSPEFSTNSFTCDSCRGEIAVPRVLGFCSSCKKFFQSEKVIKQKIYKYHQTSEGNDSKMSSSNFSIPSYGFDNPINPVPVERQANIPLMTQRKYSTNFLLVAFHENKTPYLAEERFRSQMSREIDFASLHQTDLSIMSIGIANFNQVLLRFSSHVLIKIFKSILMVATDYLRSSDILSLDAQQQKLLIMMPNTHLKIAKIIAKRILQRFSRFQNKFLIEVQLASFPQDGKTSDEVLEMMTLGIEKVTSDFLD